MAKIVLTINANNKATQSVRILNAEVKTLAETLSTIKVNKNLTAQINALSKYYKSLAEAGTKATKALTATERTVYSTKKQAASLYAEIAKLNAKENGRYDSLLKSASRYLSKTHELAAAMSKNGKLNETELKQLQSVQREMLKLSATVKSHTATSKEYAQAQDKATQSTQKQTITIKQNTEANKEHRQSILSMTRGILEWQIATTLVMKPLRALQDALTSINETLVATEDRVIELQRVVGDVANANELYDLAAKYGQTFENVSEATLNFARRGMSWNESLKATEAALLAINVAELDVGQATDGLGAIMAQFGIQASELTNVVDMLNKTADKFPVTTEKILVALQRTGSTASTANLSLEETIGLITTLSKSTNRSGENIGTALNSILNIAQKDSTLETFSKLGGDVAQIVEQYRGGGTSILEVLRAVSAEVQNLNTNQIFDSEAFSALNEDLKESMGQDFEMLQEIYGTAGTYRRNYFIALLNDLDTVKQVENEISGIQGYSQDENQKYLDTYTAKLNKFKAQWEEVANSEQGLLGLKKLFVDLGSAILTAMQWTNGLRTSFIVAGTAGATLFAPKIIKGWQSLITHIKGVQNPLKIYQRAIETSRLAQEAQIVATKAQTVADEKNAIATRLKMSATATDTQIRVAETAATEAQTFATNKQVVADELATKATRAKTIAMQASVVAVGAVIAAVSIGIGIWQKYEQEQEEVRKKALQTATDGLEPLKEAIVELTELYNEYADKVKKAREVLLDENSSTAQISSAKNTLLDIQNNLIKSNKEYAGSIDLVNGDLERQLELLSQLSEDEARKKVTEYLSSNTDAIYEAEKYWNNKSTTVQFQDKKNTWTDAFGKDSKLEAWLKEQGYDVGYYTDQNKSSSSQFSDSAGALIGKNNLLATIDAENAMTIEERLDFLEKLFNQAEGNDEVQAIIRKTINAIKNDENYKNSENLIKGTSNSWNAPLEVLKQFKEGAITYTEFLKKIGALQEEIDPSSPSWTNNIKDVTRKYNDLISKLEELRDLEEESAAIEEKKKNYLEAQNELIKAQQALENAKNEATVRRYNQETGQWEWQVDEKKIQEAEEAVKKQEESVEKAREELQKQAYDTIIKQLQEKTATNDGIKEILNDLIPHLGEEFATAVKGAIKNQTGVDLDKPINEESDEESLKHPKKEKWTSYADAASDGFSNIRTEKEFKRSSADKEKYGTYQAYLDAMHEKYSGTYDNGGIANGLGYMRKATTEPESVNNPELTKKILSPVSNAEFNRYVKDMGIMFGISHQYAQSPIIERVGGNTDNRVNNSGQVFIQGVNVGAEKRDGIMDALALAPIVNNN